MKVKKNDLHGFEGVARVARAITYPVLVNGPNLTLVELYTLTTLPGAIDFMKSIEEKCDVIDAYLVKPGLAQGYRGGAQQLLEALKSLAEKGLVHLKDGEYCMSRQLREALPPTLAQLTKEGLELLHAMGGNMKKSLSTLDDEEVRLSLAGYAV